MGRRRCELGSLGSDLRMLAYYAALALVGVLTVCPGARPAMMRQDT